MHKYAKAILVTQGYDEMTQFTFYTFILSKRKMGILVPSTFNNLCVLEDECIIIRLQKNSFCLCGIFDQNLTEVIQHLICDEAEPAEMTRCKVCLW